MTGFAGLSLALNLLYFVIALAVIRVALWYMNRSTGVKFGEVLSKINADPLAAAVYFGLRLIALCYLASALVH